MQFAGDGYSLAVLYFMGLGSLTAIGLMGYLVISTWDFCSQEKPNNLENKIQNDIHSVSKRNLVSEKDTFNYVDYFEKESRE